MKIVLSGVETNNKGAELMLYAILQEIESKFPDAIVYISEMSIRQGISYVKTNLDLRLLAIEKLINKIHLNGILYRLGLPKINCMSLVKADYYLDASGFLFSDQTNLFGTKPEEWKHLLKKQKRHGAKIVFLPQAFGPFELESTKKTIGIISQYSNIIIAREQVSFEYLKNTGLVDMRKVRKYPDFTSLVPGKFPSYYNHLKNGVCVIPNERMIQKGMISLDGYITLLLKIINKAKNNGRCVYLLNHEGVGDEKLALMCKSKLNNMIDVVTGLDAFEVKGIISSAYLVISSRFHGVASALNSCVPCLSTSWSHKYEQLFSDYDQKDCVLPLDNEEYCLNKVEEFLNEDIHEKIKAVLKKKLPYVQEETRKMWNEVWNCD